MDTIRPECVCYSGSILDPVDLRWRCQVVFVSQPVDVCHRGCTYTVLQTVQRPGVYSAVYGTVDYKEPLNSFDKSRA